MNRKLWFILLLGMLLTGCRKELCYIHDQHTLRVEYDLSFSYDLEWEYNRENHVDWEQVWDNVAMGMNYEALRPTPPEGVRMHIYDEKDHTEDVRNLPRQGANVYFNDEGHYSVLFHNNDTEYIVYQGMNSFATAYATTRGLSRGTYFGNSLMGSKQGEEVTVSPPDMLFGAYMDSVYVEKSTQTGTMQVTLRPLVFTYLVRYEVEEGLENAVLVRGALAGMARGVNLGNGRTSKETATVLYDATKTDFGAQALVKTFGVPDYPNPDYSRHPRSYGLNLEVMVGDGSIQQFEFDVTDQVEKQPHGGVIVVKGIKIEPPKQNEGGGGFDVGVNGWGDVIDVILPL